MVNQQPTRWEKNDWLETQTQVSIKIDKIMRSSKTASYFEMNRLLFTYRIELLKESYIEPMIITNNGIISGVAKSYYFFVCT